MFAAGNSAAAALVILLDAGASISIRDRRGKNVILVLCSPLHAGSAGWSGGAAGGLTC